MHPCQLERMRLCHCFKDIKPDSRILLILVKRLLTSRHGLPCASAALKALRNASESSGLRFACCSRTTGSSTHLFYRSSRWETVGREIAFRTSCR